MSFNIDRLEKAFLHRADGIEEVVEEILNKQADILVEEQKRQIKELGLVDTRSLINSIRKQNYKADEERAIIEVAPHGKNSRTKTANAYVGFVLNYGTSKMPAKPYSTRAREISASAREQVAMEVWNARNIK